MMCTISTIADVHTGLLGKCTQLLDPGASTPLPNQPLQARKPDQGSAAGEIRTLEAHPRTE